MTAADGVVGPLVFGRCTACDDRALCQDGLCRYCRESQTWSRINRQFCALIHAASPGRRLRAMSSVEPKD